MPLRRLLFFVLLVLLLLLAGAVTQAQESPFAPEEEQFLALLQRDNKPLEAREAAKAYLEKHPDSSPALLVVGSVSLFKDADLPRAYHYLKRAKKGYEKSWPTASEGPWRLYGQILWTLRVACQRMERYEEALDLLILSDDLFEPDSPADYAWPLMKLGREKEARAKIAEARKSNQPEQFLHAVNSLGALEGEADHPDQALAVFEELYELQGKYGLYDCTSIRNLGENHLKVLQFAEAERYYLESARYFQAHSESNPWMDLANLYLLENRFAEAVDAVKKMQSWSYRSEPVVGLDNWNYRETLAAALLARLGYTEESLALARRTAERPDRHGYGSADGDQWVASSLFFLRELLLEEAARLEEERSWSSWTRGLTLWARELSLRLEAASSGRRAARILMAEGWLGDTLRFVGPNSAIAFPGGEAGVCEAVGPAVAEAQLRSLMERKGPSAERERPLLEFLLGKCLLDSGDAQGALAAFARAEKGLPKEFASAWSQMGAFRALALQRTGDLKGSQEEMVTLLESDPGTLRRYGLALPCALEARGGSTAARTVELLSASPRLDTSRRGFRLVVTQNATGSLEGVLEEAGGSVLSVVRVPAGKTPPATAEAFCRAFHQKTFAPKLDLSQAEIRSLDGSTLAGEASRDALKGILGGPAPEGSGVRREE